MGKEVVVAGVASLAVQLAVEGFPIEYTSVSTPRWLESGLGGAGANIATVLQHLGNGVRLCSVVGSDSVGLLVRQQLSARGLDGPGIVEGPGSSQTVVLVAEDGRRIVYPYLAPVDAIEYPAHVFIEALRSADLAVLTSTAFARALVPYAVKHCIPIAVDLNVIEDLKEICWRPWLEAAEIIFCSHERLPCSPTEWLSRLLKCYPQVTVAAVGCGDQGAVLGLRDGRVLQIKAVAPSGVVSTSSAGDSLFAAFLHFWLRAGDPIEALSQAAIFAGWRVGHRDPSMALLSEQELLQLRWRHPVRVSLGRWDHDSEQA